MALHKRFPRLVGNVSALIDLGGSLGQLARFALSGNRVDNHYVGKRYAIPSVGNQAFGAVEVGDVDLNFFLRVVLEGNFRTVIEIGAATCHRIKAIARLFPAVEAHALDIGTAFTPPPRTDEGVRIAALDPSFFQATRDRPVVMSSATLACMRPQELDDFLGLLARNGYALALSEPGFRFDLDRAVPRNRLSFYHPWKRCLEAAGFELAEADVGIKNCAWRLNIPKCNGEAWLQIFAQPRA